MLFLIVLALTTLSIAGTTAYFSVWGLAQIFSGTFWSVVLMTSTLEVGKLVTTSLVYQYWKHFHFLLKTLYITIISVLMLITACGTFGYLAASHQQGSSSLSESNTKITLLQHQKEQSELLKTQQLTRREQIDDQVAKLPSNSVKARQKVANQFKDERDKIQLEVDRYTTDIETKTKQIGDLQLIQVQQEAHVGPILYVAKALGRNVDDAIIGMIMLLMFVSDPLAVALTIGFNIALSKRKEQKISTSQYQDFDQDDEPSPSVISTDNLASKGNESWDFYADDEIFHEKEGINLIKVNNQQNMEVPIISPPIQAVQPVSTFKETNYPPNIRKILKIDDKQKSVDNL